MTTRTTLDKAMTEDELLQAITEAATLYGWKWHHVRRSDKALQMGDPGFPDLVLAKIGRAPLFLELKTKRGPLTDAQADWLAALDGSEVVRPWDLDYWLQRLAR